MSGVTWSLTMKNPMCGCRVLYQQPALPTNVTQSSQIAVTPRPGPGPVPSRYTPRLWAPFSVPSGTVTSRVIVCSSTITTLLTSASSTGVVPGRKLVPVTVTGVVIPTGSMSGRTDVILSCGRARMTTSHEPLVWLGNRLVAPVRNAT